MGFGLTDVPAVYAACAGGDFLNPIAHELMIDYTAAQALREAATMRRIAIESGGREAVKKSTRGAARQVVCLTDIDPTTGMLRRFTRVSGAAEWVDRSCNNICQAIRRSGKCGEHLWAYSDGLTQMDELRRIKELRKEAGPPHNSPRKAA